MKDYVPTMREVMSALAFNYVIYAMCLFVFISGLFLLTLDKFMEHQLLFGVISIVLPVVMFCIFNQNTKELHRVRRQLIHQNK